MEAMRARQVKKGREGRGPVIYWMSRDQRAEDNFALLHAQLSAVERDVPLIVAFCLVPSFLGATERQYRFMFGGLRKVEAELRSKGIGFELLFGDPGNEVPELVREVDASRLVTDFDPLRPKVAWRREVRKEVEVPVMEVDTHNIVPCWLTSDKREYAARTIRPKVHRLLDDFLTGIPRLEVHPHPWASEEVDWGRWWSRLDIDRSVKAVEWVVPGTGAEVLKEFISSGLVSYDERRNDPGSTGQSDLSPFLHFGQLSPHRVALEVTASPYPDDLKIGFQEELVVRRELADNFCHHTQDYDSVTAFPEWARKTLREHAKDRREYLYSYQDLDRASTHDEYWNAAQMEMVLRGKMHGYMRMYWAKKILEWTEGPEEALDIAIRLNDRYELDGRDPNGYAGIAWSIGGVHDRAFAEREVFGKVRYMSARGLRSKFDMKAYCERVRSLAEG
jgi:deoxyribodipyrimidine photo-lyase